MICQRTLACRAIANSSDRNITDRHIADRNNSMLVNLRLPHFCDMRSRDRNITNRKVCKLFSMGTSMLRCDVVINTGAARILVFRREMKVFLILMRCDLKDLLS